MNHMDAWPNETLFSIKGPLMGAAEVGWCVHLQSVGVRELFCGTRTSSWRFFLK